jgi:histidyl-tRNA synthetase
LLYKSPRGTVDILPEEQKFWRYVESKAVEVSRLYGYERLDTPVFEDSGLFTRSIGDGTDIVTKEMYVFTDLSDNSLALRPEGTASVCRAYLEHGMHNKPQPVKLYYLTAIFRYERPQSGRYRQHYQFGCEAIGDIDPALDAEVIEMAWQFFTMLGLKDLTLQLNSIGCKVCRPRFLDSLKQHYASHINELCQDCRTRLVKNPLRLLDCKQPACQAAADAAPKSSEHLCHECDDHFRSVQGYLHRLEIPFNINHRLVRGLDYYTRTVFEVQPYD